MQNLIWMITILLSLVNRIVLFIKYIIIFVIIIIIIISSSRSSSSSSKSDKK